MPPAPIDPHLVANTAREVLAQLRLLAAEAGLPSLTDILGDAEDEARRVVSRTRPAEPARP